MKHIQAYTLYENAVKRDLMGELKHALYETTAGKDLLAIAKIGGMASESLTTWVRFESEIKYMGDRRIAAVQTIYKGREGRQGAVGDPIMWSWGYNPAGEWGPSYQHGGDFMTAEECLSSFWLDLVTRLCDQIFEDREERIAHADLIKAHKQLLVGQAYEILDLIYLIDNLKEIIEGKVNPSVANTLRKDFPNIWKTLGDRKNDGLETAADLGDLGF